MAGAQMSAILLLGTAAATHVTPGRPQLVTFTAQRIDTRRRRAFLRCQQLWALRERGRYTKGLKREEMIAILADSPDFKNEQPLLQRLVEERGHEVLYIPK